MWLNESATWREANSAESAEEPERALALYSELFLQLETNRKQVPSVLVERMADCSRALERFTQALELFKVARDGMLETGDRDGARRVTARISAALLEAGRPDDAMALLRDTLGLEPEVEMVGALSQLLNDHTRASLFALACAEAGARCLAATGRYRDAISITRRAARAASNVAPARVGDYEMFLAELLVDSGLFAQALALIPSPPSARWSLIAARLERFRGELGAALEHCRRVENATLPGVLRSKAALLHAAILSQLNRLGAADAVLQAAASHQDTPQVWASRMRRAAALLSLRRQATQDSVQLPLGLDDLWAASEEGERKPLPDASPSVDELGERYADRVAAALNRISVALARGQAPLEALTQVQALRAGCDAPLQQQRLWAGEAWIRYYAKQYATSEECWYRALALAEELRTPLYSWEAKLSLSWCAARRGDLAGQEQMARSAREDLEGMAAALDVAQRRHFLLNKVSARDEYLALEARSILRAASPWFRVPWLGPWLERRQQSNKTRGLMNRVALISQFGVAQQLAGTTWRATVDTAVTANQIEQLVKQQLEATRSSASDFAAHRFALNCHRRLKADEMVVQYLPLPDQLLIVWTTRFRAGLICSAVTRPELDAAVRDCLKGIIEQEELSLPASHVLKPLRRLSELLRVEQLRGLVKGCTHWFVAPADVLVNVPFAALLVGGDAFLVESRTLSLIPNPAWLRTVRSKPKINRALIVGCSSYPPSSQLAGLPNALREAEAVADELSGRFGVTCLLDTAANEQSVLEQLAGADIAHFACHGEANAEAPLRSCLLFSGNGTAGDRLTAERLYGLSLPLRVAVLAACRASASTPLPDNDLVGIPAAFLHAGAESVIAPLWEVSDELSENVMRQLHQQLAHRSAAAALSAVQRSRCRSSDETDSRVFNWAAYTCFSLN